MAIGSTIDPILRHAVASGDVPGVTALAAGDRGILYEGAFGLRDIASGLKMTADTIFRIASMTKVVTSVAAMQLVEQGRVALDEPIGRVLPELAAPMVLQGFAASGKPRLRLAKRPVTLRHLLTHTAGFGYEMLCGDLIRFVAVTRMPSTSTGEIASLRLPLLFDPGERWEYGISIDWVGRAIEAVSGQSLSDYFHDHIFAPLGMADSGFVLTAEQRQRLMRVHRRNAEGSLEPITIDLRPSRPEFWSGVVHCIRPDRTI
jgi:CubicO group peptidase (beta-lactamase class C family)